MADFDASPAHRIAPKDYLAQHSSSDQLVDVRTPEEHAEGHLPGSANVDVKQPTFAQDIEALGLDKSRPVYLYCRSGGRSEKATQILRQMGYDEAYNVGGALHYQALGAPMEQ
jgi:rhodanese-related sulfurtransferase